MHRSMSRVLHHAVAKPWLALGAAFGLSWAGGAALAGPATIATAIAAARVTTPVAADAGDERSCAGGVDAPVEVAIAPARSVAHAGGEGLVLDVALTNKLGGAAADRRADSAMRVGTRRSSD